MHFVLQFSRWYRQGHSFLIRVWPRRFMSPPMAVSEEAVLVVAPHQDDETLGCGGLIALKRAAGITVRVVFLTDGSAAVKPDPETNKKDFVLARKREALRALRALNVAGNCVSFLDMIDATLRDTRSEEVTTGQLATLLIAHPPQEVYVPHRHDCHPDHEAAWQITRAAVQRAGLKVDLIQYPIWILWSAPLFLHLFPRHLAGARRLCIRSVRTQKQRAIAAYASQCTTLPRGFLGQFLGSDEIFLFQDKT